MTTAVRGAHACGLSTATQRSGARQAPKSRQYPCYGHGRPLLTLLNTTPKTLARLHLLREFSSEKEESYPIRPR